MPSSISPHSAVRETKILLYVLTVGDLEERVALVDKLMQDGKIAFLQEYITRKKKEVAHHGEEPENA